MVVLAHGSIESHVRWNVAETPGVMMGLGEAEKSTEC